MLHKKNFIFPLPPNADASYYCHVLQERGVYIKQLKAGTLSFKEAYAAYPKLIKNKASAMQLEGLAQIIAATEYLTSTEQLKWIGKQPLYEDGQLVAMGTLQINGATKAMPTNPGDSGNIQQYDGTSHIAIIDTVANKALQFIAVKIDGKQLLVCDRNVVVKISWNTLNNLNLITGKELTIDGQKYKLRVLTGGAKEGDPCEWDRMMTAVGDENAIWHWKNMYSWCQETITTSNSSRALRGYSSAAHWYDSYATSSTTHVGWRPVFEIL